VSWEQALLYLQWHRKKKGLPEMCFKHIRKPYTLVKLVEARLLQQYGAPPQAQNSNRQKISESTGGRQRLTWTRTRQVVSAIEQEFKMLKGSSKGDNEIALRLNRLTQRDLASSLGINVSEGYPLADKRIEKWFAPCRLRELYPAARSPFREFLEEVVRELLASNSVEQIAQSLEARRAAPAQVT
jgi:hypothetical protein